ATALGGRRFARKGERPIRLRSKGISIIALMVLSLGSFIFTVVDSFTSLLTDYDRRVFLLAILLIYLLLLEAYDLYSIFKSTNRLWLLTSLLVFCVFYLTFVHVAIEWVTTFLAPTPPIHTMFLPVAYAALTLAILVSLSPFSFVVLRICPVRPLLHRLVFQA